MWSIVTRKSFLKDLTALPAKVRDKVEAFVFEVLPASENPFQIGKLEKLKGSEDF
jgi:mRNA-degrading endonuclease RelE of RelBE toxin-antitoxin system